MVQYRAFKVGLSETASERLNAFLRQNTVVSVDKQFLEAGAESFFAFLVEYDAQSPDTKYDRTEKVDYAKILNEHQFVCFNELRKRGRRFKNNLIYTRSFPSLLLTPARPFNSEYLEKQPFLRETSA